MRGLIALAVIIGTLAFVAGVGGDASTACGVVALAHVRAVAYGADDNRTRPLYQTPRVEAHVEVVAHVRKRGVESPLQPSAEGLFVAAEVLCAGYAAEIEARFEGEFFYAY